MSLISGGLLGKMLTLEQTEHIKQQIIQQIDENFPNDKKNDAKRQIISMNSEQLEEFLKQNQIAQKQQPLQNPFRAIVAGEISSYKIDENKSALAVLEINPISKGHALVIPKKQIPEGKKIPKTISSFAEKVGKKIQTRFKSKDVQISASNFLGETILNILPIYKDETLDSKRQQAKPEELEAVQKILEKKQRKKVIRKPKPKKLKEKLWLPKRIP